MIAMHPLTLSFRNTELEASYNVASLPHDRIHGRTAMIVGSIVYLLYGLLDTWVVPKEDMSTIWTIRLTTLIAAVVVFLVSFTPAFDRNRHLLLASTGFAAGMGLIVMLATLTVESAPNFYPGLVLATFYTYNFVGTRFVYALCVDLSLFLCYNVIFGHFQHYPLEVLARHDFFIVSANLIGGIAGYLTEKQRRMLFLRERELDEERTMHLNRSLHDALTGLPNRDLLYDRLEHAAAMAQREDDTCCAMFIDLDGFKQVNDKLGHDAGDRVLKTVAQRLREAVRDSDTVARLGGDEFFVIVYGIDSVAEARAFGDKLIASISDPLPGVPAELAISASIGICLFPYQGMTVADTIRRADEAMYKAKTGGKSACVLAATVPVAVSA